MVNSQHPSISSSVVLFLAVHSSVLCIAGPAFFYLSAVQDVAKLLIHTYEFSNKLWLSLQCCY
jgi:hypothetical protein